ncbi:hypothetical protein [Microtetraspora sp. NBRC 16547]|uniref:hypothetical protein n=1 Tax=Microtetraspora sp. NBRC 16547 TaxID=3030993 RepID=UPI002552300A|nr:hypothetical protein [Microtetraspora sp. NBRC 16547]
MSTTPPGSTSLVQMGKPSGSHRAWTLPPKSPVLPENQGVDGFAFHAGGLHAAAVGVEDFAVEDEVGDAVGGVFQGFVQVGGLIGQDVDGLV